MRSMWTTKTRPGARVPKTVRTAHRPRRGRYPRPRDPRRTLDRAPPGARRPSPRPVVSTKGRRPRARARRPSASWAPRPRGDRRRGSPPPARAPESGASFRAPVLLEPDEDQPLPAPLAPQDGLPRGLHLRYPHHSAAPSPDAVAAEIPDGPRPFSPSLTVALRWPQRLSGCTSISTAGVDTRVPTPTAARAPSRGRRRGEGRGRGLWPPGTTRPSRVLGAGAGPRRCGFTTGAVPLPIGAARHPPARAQAVELASLGVVIHSSSTALPQCISFVWGFATCTKPAPLACLTFKLFWSPSEPRRPPRSLRHTKRTLGAGPSRYPFPISRGITFSTKRSIPAGFG